MDETTGVLSGWNLYNSGSSNITQVTTNNYVSATHALTVVDMTQTITVHVYSDSVPLSGLYKFEWHHKRAVVPTLQHYQWQYAGDFLVL